MQRHVGSDSVKKSSSRILDLVGWGRSSVLVSKYIIRWDSGHTDSDKVSRRKTTVSFQETREVGQMAVLTLSVTSIAFSCLYSKGCKRKCSYPGIPGPLGVFGDARKSMQRSLLDGRQACKQRGINMHESGRTQTHEYL